MIGCQKKKKGNRLQLLDQDEISRRSISGYFYQTCIKVNGTRRRKHECTIQSVHTVIFHCNLNHVSIASEVLKIF